MYKKVKIKNQVKKDLKDNLLKSITYICCKSGINKIKKMIPFFAV